jgi:hypothetical protein
LFPIQTFVEIDFRHESERGVIKQVGERINLFHASFAAAHDDIGL